MGDLGGIGLKSSILKNYCKSIYVLGFHLSYIFLKKYTYTAIKCSYYVVLEVRK